MNRSTALVYATVTIVVGVTVLSGPSVGLVDLTSPRYDTGGYGNGSLTVDGVDAPASVELAKGYQSESYRLEVPDTRIYIQSISGKPILSYELEIQALGLSRSTAHFLGNAGTGWLTLSTPGVTVAGDQIDQPTYNGTLSVIERDGENGTVIYREPVTVEVRS